MWIDAGSPVIIMLWQVNKQVQGKLGILNSIREHGKKVIETRKVAYTCRYTTVVDIQSLNHLFNP